MQEAILQFLQVTGPTLPGKVAKHLNLPLLLASAGLADLSSQGKIKVSKLKVGGSPLYYLPGQEEQLIQFAASNLDPKDFRVLQRLEEERILRESELDLLSKVALRHMPDFALPLQVSFQENTELFWKWHLLSEEETGSRIKKMLFVPQEVAAKPQEVPIKTPEEKLPPNLATMQKKLVEEANLSSAPSTTKEIEEINKVRKKRTPVEEDFLPEVELFFKHLKIDLEQKEIVRKNAELNFLAKVPSVVGSLKYFCKAKQKKRCDEKDLSAAYMEAQIKKLPLLFLYSDELSKKAEEMLKSGAFENAIVKKINEEDK